MQQRNPLVIVVIAVLVAGMLFFGLHMARRAKGPGPPDITGQPAPEFTLTSLDGKTVRLADYKGKLVVLEWFNPECPFVGKHYGSGHMQGLQQEWTAKGVVWLTIDSSAPGRQGYVDAARASGYSHARIILRHMLPNVMAPILIMATAFLGEAILLEASLSCRHVQVDGIFSHFANADAADLTSARLQLEQRPHTLELG